MAKDTREASTSKNRILFQKPFCFDFRAQTVFVAHARHEATDDSGIPNFPSTSGKMLHHQNGVFATWI